MSSIAVVGGGMLGMTLALRLKQRGFDVTVLEGAPKIGGLASAQSIGGYTWDRFYHVTLLSDQRLLALLGELGLGDRLHWQSTRTGFFVDGRHHWLSTPIDFLRFPPLTLFDKARLALTILYASRLRDWRPLERIPVSRWLRRWSGRRTCERIWLPLLRAKLGDNYQRTNAAFIWSTIARMYAARRAGLKRELFGFVDGGYDTVLRVLEEHVRAAGVEIRCGFPVAEVRDVGYGVEVRAGGGERRTFDRAILTVSTRLAAEICPELTEAERTRLTAVTYQGIACASLLLRRPLANCYITNIAAPDIPFTGVIEMTALTGRERFGGNALVYLPRYLTAGDPFWRKSDEEIRTEFFAGLARMYPDFSPADVLAFQVARVREVFALPTLGYSEELMPPVRTSLPNVFLVNSAQLVHGTLTVNETVTLAETRAEALAPLLRRATGAAPAAALEAR